MTIVLLYQKDFQGNIVLRHALAIHAHHPTNVSKNSVRATKAKKTLANTTQERKQTIMPRTRPAPQQH